MWRRQPRFSDGEEGMEHGSSVSRPTINNSGDLIKRLRDIITRLTAGSDSESDSELEL